MKTRKVGKRGYYEYLKSPEWKATKLRYLKSKLPKNCGVCDAEWNNSMVFHHKTYKRLGDERLTDIVPVCRACHERIHEFHREQQLLPKDRKRPRGLWHATKRVRNMARAPI